MRTKKIILTALVLLSACNIERLEQSSAKPACDQQDFVPEEIQTAEDGYFAIEGEQQKCLPLTKGHPFIQKTLLAVKLEDVQAGDTWTFMADAQVTNDVGYNVMVAYNMALSSSPSYDDVIKLVTNSRGYNASPKFHHAPISAQQVYRFTESYEEVYLVFAVWTASTKTKSGDTIHVDLGYGNLSGVRH